ncbi:hypothetical protein Moror_9981 [Moniliophthora roreri MCA 2997]|uniref:Uncharacterized protein n=2 Tax=Moniliophthora roreri TaxID=221103 RepID=V2WFH8_MONRO|nr:hypothetical protein Moror_9981 [Moniliophthora roreri MCA 2997]
MAVHSKLTKTVDTDPTQLNAVTTAFAGLRQVISEYHEEGEAFQEMAEDDLNGEQEIVKSAALSLSHVLTMTAPS